MKENALEYPIMVQMGILIALRSGPNLVHPGPSDIGVEDLAVFMHTPIALIKTTLCRLEMQKLVTRDRYGDGSKKLGLTREGWKLVGNCEQELSLTPENYYLLQCYAAMEGLSLEEAVTKIIKSAIQRDEWEEDTSWKWN